MPNSINHLNSSQVKPPWLLFDIVSCYSNCIFLVSHCYSVTTWPLLLQNFLVSMCVNGRLSDSSTIILGLQRIITEFHSDISVISPILFLMPLVNDRYPRLLPENITLMELLVLHHVYFPTCPLPLTALFLPLLCIRTTQIFLLQWV